MEQSRTGTGVRAFGDDFEGNLGQLRAYAPIITRGDVRGLLLPRKQSNQPQMNTDKQKNVQGLGLSVFIWGQRLF
jgi:hypothetical protein